MIQSNFKNIHRNKKWAITRDGIKMSYYDYLKSHYWTETKIRYRKSKLDQDCFCCGTNEKLEYHHRTYKRLGHENLHDLIPVCRSCHQKIHDRWQRQYNEWILSGSKKNKPKFYHQGKKVRRNIRKKHRLTTGKKLSKTNT